MAKTLGLLWFSWFLCRRSDAFLIEVMSVYSILHLTVGMGGILAPPTLTAGNVNALDAGWPETFVRGRTRAAAWCVWEHSLIEVHHCSWLNTLELIGTHWRGWHRARLQSWVRNQQFEAWSIHDCEWKLTLKVHRMSKVDAVNTCAIQDELCLHAKNRTAFTQISRATTWFMTIIFRT